MKNKIYNYWKLLKSHPYESVILMVSLGGFLINAHYVSYPDEFVNLLGGKEILQGKIPYKDFFDHHMPGAWYLSALLQLPAFGSYVLFRIYFALFQFGILAWLYIWIAKKHFHIARFYLVFLLIYPFLAVYYWLHLYLGDSLAALFIGITFWMLYTLSTQKTLQKKDIYLVIAGITLTLFSSLSYLYVCAIMLLWALYLSFTRSPFGMRALFACILPWLVYGLFLVITGSFHQFYFANATYNAQYYVSIPNYERSSHINPLKLASTLVYNFGESFLVLLTGVVRDFSLYLPYTKFIALGVVGILMAQIAKKNIITFLGMLGIIVFSSPRGPVDNIGETNYQQAVFLIIGGIYGLMALYELSRLTFRTVYIEYTKNIITTLLFIFGMFSCLYFGLNTYVKWFKRQTAVMPAISNNAPIAEFVDQMVAKGETYWVGPYEPQETFFVKHGVFAGRYPSLLPQFRESDFLSKDFIAQQEEYKPAIVIYREEASIFQTPALEFGAFYLENFLKKNYTRASSLSHISIVKSPYGMNVSTDLWIRNDRIQEETKQLVDNHYADYR